MEMTMSDEDTLKQMKEARKAKDYCACEEKCPCCGKPKRPASWTWPTWDRPYYPTYPIYPYWGGASNWQ